ncbi:SNF2-related protein [Desulfobulbus propionicus DSM 2032]|uniref:SNF2-related protein n=1 Tax=Desulfobulbus propionicus (strain ATCC 33891 / DSM 2032 / VKM B-1956 / 1pr3) TaxID=577650 RepID=A0A7U3YKJ7_DESPD|nr:DEAD/DEAH box helicase [Desulfobulbus propionicus]ADW17087.1 SNF2-related protein [Desulfobulbus propionicus DSM 2032]
MSPPHRDADRAKLLEQINRLSPLERSVLYVLAVAAEPVANATVCTLCTQAGLPLNDETDGPPLTSLAPQLRRLRTLGLIDEHNLINELIVEVVVRRLFADKQSTITPLPQTVETAKKRVIPNRSGVKTRAPKPQPLPVPVFLAWSIITAVRSVLPAPTTSYSFMGRQLTAACSRTQRELRIALYYGDDASSLAALTDTLLSHCCEHQPFIHPLVRLVANPFDPVWCTTLPAARQIQLLTLILSHSFFYLEAEPEAWKLACDPALRAAASPGDRVTLLYYLIHQHILSGQTAQARQCIEEMRRDTANYAFGFGGWIALIEGRIDEALELFESDLKELRKRQRKRAALLSSDLTPFFLLALLRKGDAASLGKAGVYLDQALRRSEPVNSIAVGLASIEAMLGSQSGLSAEAARRPLRPYTEKRSKIEGALGPLLVGMALFSIDGRLARKDITLLNQSFERAREAGFDWLALEYAQLLCRADKETTSRREYVRATRETLGLVPLTAGIEVEVPWRKSLRALRMAAEGADKPNTEGGHGPRNRIVYLLRFAATGALAEISPLEQKLSAKGVWTKGRPIALQRLVSGDKLDGLTEADHPLRAAIRRVDAYYGSHHYAFNLKQALPALIGHPLLFLADALTTPVEVLKGEPEILVVGKGKDMVIRFSPDVGSEERYALVRETPSRYRVVECTEAHHRLARILGAKGLTLPASAMDEVAPVLASMASLVTVHSTIPGTAHAVTAIPADPRPRVHLLPHGEGFRLEVFVRPLGNGGPYLKAGQGAKNLMADVEDRKCQTERNLQEERARAAALVRSLPSLAALSELDGQWFAESPEEALQVLLELRERQEHGDALVEWPEGEKLKVGPPVSCANMRLRLGSADNWFEVEGELRVDQERVLNIKQLLDLVQTTPHRFLPLGDGEFVALSHELRKRLDELAAYADKRGKKIGVHPLAALALEEFTHQVGELDAAPQWFERISRLREGLAQTPQPPSTLKAQLRDYQRDGFHWLARLAHLGLGACLADDMGLGKTVQTLAAILHQAPQGPTLVIAPTSVCANWLAEARRFAPTLNGIPFGGTDRQNQIAHLGPFDLVVASYGLLHQESHLLTAVQWQTVVLDEAQAIKNAATKRSQAAMHLQARFRVVTTGTPIENHLGEFWTLFNFINPGLLGSRERFTTRFAAPIERHNDREVARRLKKLVQPFILRRLKSQVLEELPPRTEVVLRVELSPEETAFYEALRQQALERIDAEQGTNGQKPMRILAEITRLRQACCHPRLLQADSTIAGAKLALFGEVVAELLDNGHKALVFSQFVGHLALIREYLDARAIPYRYLDGSTPPKERQREVEAFQAGQGDLFLISLKAGGLGLNLTAADYVIHMDPWWNPAVEDQASDRAHRIGQQRPVTVYRLVAQQTIEEKIVRLHAEKRDLADSLLDATDTSASLSADDLLRLIREG